MEQGPRGTGPTRRRSTCEKDCARAEMEQEQSKRDQRDHARERLKTETLHQKRVRQRRKSRTDTRTTLRSLSETLQMTTLPSSPLPSISRPQHLAPTRYTWLQRISTCTFPDILLREAYCVHAYS